MTFVEDRFATQLSAVTPDATIPLLRSVEGASTDVWPASGALQEILPQSNDDGDYLAGVGRAGKSHWSTIVSAPGPKSSCEFDFACRVKTTPAWIGSTYQVLIDGLAVAVEDRIELPISDEIGHLMCSGLDGTRLQLAEPQRLRFCPSNTDEDFPRTERWKYRFELG